MFNPSSLPLVEREAIETNILSPLLTPVTAQLHLAVVDAAIVVAPAGSVQFTFPEICFVCAVPDDPRVKVEVRASAPENEPAPERVYGKAEFSPPFAR